MYQYIGAGTCILIAYANHEDLDQLNQVFRGPPTELLCTVEYIGDYRKRVLDGAVCENDSSLLRELVIRYTI